jgi:hypothetical protein
MVEGGAPALSALLRCRALATAGMVRPMNMDSPAGACDPALTPWE